MAVRVLAASQRSDVRTLSEFRKQHLTLLPELFVQVLQLCQRAGLVRLRHGAGWHQGQGDCVKAQGDELSTDGDGGGATHEARKAESPRRGRPPQPSSPVPHPKAQRNFTDAESQIMPASDAKGSVVQRYNCRSAVDDIDQIIIVADVTDEPDDMQQAQSMLTQVLAQTGQVPLTVTIDAGSFSEANVMALTALGCTPLVPPDRQLHGQVVLAAPRGRPPSGLSVADRMRRTLRNQRGRRRYVRRKAIVEPVFGQIKQGRGSRQFLLRGMRQARGEWALISTTHNGVKLWTALRRQRRRPNEGLRALDRGRKAERKTQG